MAISNLPSILQFDGETGALNEVKAVAHLEDYFTGTGFSGSYFELLGGGGDSVGSANRITEADLLSLATLSVPVGGHAARQLLTEPLAAQVGALLAQIPAELSIETADGRSALQRGGAAWGLWDLLRTVGKDAPRGNAFGQVRTSKLLARKRPHLIPIYDAVVASQFGLSGSADQWTIWSELFSNETFVEALRRIREQVASAHHVSLLRVLDVVVWMEGRGASGDEGTQIEG